MRLRCQACSGSGRGKVDDDVDTVYSGLLELTSAGGAAKEEMVFLSFFVVEFFIFKYFFLRF